jgi:hypothetical protein
VAVAEVAVVVAAVSEAAVSAAVAGVGVVAEVGAAASVFEAEVATSATAGVATSARTDRGAIGVIFTHDPNRTTKIRCVGRSGALYYFWQLRIAAIALRQPFRSVIRCARLTCIHPPMRRCGSRRLLHQQACKAKPCCVIEAKALEVIKSIK